MVFSFSRLRKKREDNTGSTQLRSAKHSGGTTSTKAASKPVKVTVGARKSPAAKNQDTNRPHDFNSPMPAIEEDEPEILGTNKTNPVTPSPPAVISSLNIINNGNDVDGTEIVYGDLSVLTFEDSAQTEKAENIAMLTTEAKDEVKRQLFTPEEFDQEKPNHDPVSQPEVLESEDELQMVEPDVETAPPELDEPFDEKEMKKEDPYILELMQSELNPGGWRFAARKMDSISRIARQVMNPRKLSAESDKDDGGGGFLDAFNCTGDVTSMFYDSLCTEGPRMKKRKRPYFNEMFALNFILEATLDGIPMMYHLPPTNPVDNDWTGRSMTMYIQPGDCTGPYIAHPKLVWTSDHNGGLSRQTGSEVRTFSVDILDVHAIMDTMDDPVGDDADEEDLCFFSLTTNSGEVHLFECLSEQERDRVAIGIKNVIARMSYSLVAGDNHVVTELYNGDKQDEGDLPPLKTEAQTLAGISHAFLDSIAEPRQTLTRATL